MYIIYKNEIRGIRHMDEMPGREESNIIRGERG